MLHAALLALVTLATPLVPDPLPPVLATALRDGRPAAGAPDRHGVEAALGGFYQGRGGALAWSAGGWPTAQARGVIEVLLAAAGRGLEPEAYDASRLADAVAAASVSLLPLDGDAAARLDAALSRALLRYAGDVTRGRVEPREAGVAWPPPPAVDLAALAEDAAAGPSPEAVLAAAEPAWPGYRNLLAALPRHPGAADRIARSLERWRWLPREPAGPTVLVNVAAFELEAWDAGEAAPTLAMPVVVGRVDDPKRNTPLLSGPVASVVVAPHWEVPRRIATVDLLPRFEREPAFAARMGYFMEGPAGPEPVTARSLAAWQAGRLRLRQAPGPLNALGGVLLLFPNDQDVYLHGSPERQLFGRDRRAYSSGCVRVADAPALAAWALRGTPGWDAARLSAALDGRVTTWLAPARRPVVYIGSMTATASPGGALSLHEDLYGLDAALDLALHGAGAPLARYQARGLPESRWTKSSSG